MSRFSQTLNNYAVIARISNLPTSISNVLVGSAIGAGATNLPVQPTIILAIAVSLFYIAGMALNDLVDVKIDTVERPNRPIPAGKISSRNALLFIIFAFTIGFLLLLAFLPHSIFMAVMLIAAIVIYDLFHKKWAASVLVMGACRGLVYLLAVVAIAGVSDNTDFLNQALVFAAIITFYIVGITVVARIENTGKMDFRKWLTVAMPIAVLLVCLYQMPTEYLWPLITGSLLGLWLMRAGILVFRQPPQVKRAVLGWLSGICLVDTYFLTLLDQPLLALIAGGCFIITHLGHKRILGT
jgi:4-hydroxybenzoate polyprenyltransferase